jgi:erythromycin esterase
MQVSSDVLEWIRAAAIPLASAEPRHGHRDLEPLRAIIGDARIVSLGEATHGTREFFTLKHRLIEFCVAELGFTMVVMEANFAEALAVNDYVLHGIGTAADALTGLRWWPWDTEEVLDLIEWMRAWNDGHVRKIKFYGYDIADPPAVALGLIAYLERVAPGLAAECEAELAPVASDFGAELFAAAPEPRRLAICACIARMRQALAQRRAEWTAVTNALDWHLGALHADVLDQSVHFIAGRATYPHERAVADNVRALLAAEGPDARAVIWAHNNHVTRARVAEAGDALGAHLDATFGRDHVVVGFSFDRGSFRARAYPSIEVTEHEIAAAPPETFDAALAQAGFPLFCLDLAHGPSAGPVAAWLDTEMPMRSIGGLYGLPADNKYGISYIQSVVPRRYFDAIMFVAMTTAARPNRVRRPRAPLATLPWPSNLELAGEGFPTDWDLVTAAGEDVATACALMESAPTGVRAVRLLRGADARRWGDVRLVQQVSAQPWRGRRVRFGASVRTAAAGVGAGALLFVKVLSGPDGDESASYRSELAIVASGEAPLQSLQWELVAAEVDVPAAADCLVLGVMMVGRGAAWFGDLDVEAIAS